jgi:hypothetical protein
MIVNVYAGAIKAREALTAEQAKKLKDMYAQIAKDIKKESDKLSIRSNVSSVMRKQYLDGLSKQVNEEFEYYSKKQNELIKGSMTKVATEVVKDGNKFLGKIGIDLAGAYSYIPRNVVEDVSTGRLYKGKWTLSSAIWGNTKKNISDVDNIVAKGIADNKSALEIAKDLEKYVNPAVRKSWDWAKVYPGSSIKIDYNAQRLARTMVSHAYEESFVRDTYYNPFFTYYKWLTSGTDRVCEICHMRETEGHGVIVNGVEMPGYYNKDELPLDHPNGMCTFVIETEYDYSSANDRLAKWVYGADDPELDKFAQSLGYETEKVKESVIIK